VIPHRCSVAATTVCLEKWARPDLGGVVIVTPAVGYALEADQLRLVALERELRGVLKDQQRPGAGLSPLARSLEMPAQDGLLVDVVVGQEAVRGLGVGSVLACERDRAPDAAAELMKQAAQSFAQSRVMEPAAGDLASYPRCIVLGLPAHRSLLLHCHAAGNGPAGDSVDRQASDLWVKASL
jgi:hypothetical protein